MSQHPNARLTPRGRALLCERVGGGMRIADAAAMAGVSRQTAHKWLARARRGEPMTDRGCRPRRLARLTPPEAEARVAEARTRLLLAPLALSAETGVPARTCARIVARRGLPRLDDIDRVTGELRARGPVTRVRYERERPGELVHVDVKKVPRIPEGGGHRALGRGCGSRRGAGTSCLHVAVDDNSRVAYAEQLPDERKGTTCAFMERALAFYEGLGVTVERVMTDNGPAYRSGEFNALLEARGIGHKYTRPFSPWQNGKVERMNRTLAREWQYARAWEGEDARAEALASFIERYNWDRPHSACGGLPPMSRIVGVNNVLAHNNSRHRHGNTSLALKAGSREGRRRGRTPRASVPTHKETTGRTRRLAVSRERKTFGTSLKPQRGGEARDYFSASAFLPALMTSTILSVS